MTKQSLNLNDIANRYNFSDKEIDTIFLTILNNYGDSDHIEKMEALFLFALNNKEITTNIKVSESIDREDVLSEYLQKWVAGYFNDRHNDRLLTPLKNYGEFDNALISRVKASTNAKEDTLQSFMEGHFLFMSAENMNGVILEQYLATVLEPEGWLWCAGSIFRAIDFCYIGDDRLVLLQVKNKYNTENSSSSAIRNGTNIIKWNRLKRSRNNSYIPSSNWEKLQDIVNIPEINDLLTEESYLTYIEEFSVSDIETLD